MVSIWIMYGFPTEAIVFFVFFGQVKTPHTSYAQDARELSGAGSVLRFLSAVS